MTSTVERNAPRRRRSAFRRSLLATVALVGLVLGLTTLQSPNQTEAAWTDSEFAGSAPLSAVTLAPPQITSTVCTKALLGLLLNRFEIQWRWPSSLGPVAPGMTPVWSINGTVMPTQPTTSGPDASGTYTTSFSAGLLTELVTLLLGNSATITVGATVPGSGPPQWQSQDISTITLSVPALLGTPTCPYVNGA